MTPPGLRRRVSRPRGRLAASTMTTKTVRGPLALPLLIAVAAMAAACGSRHNSGPSTATPGAGAQSNAADRAFAAQMIPHHEMAVQMAKTAQKAAAHAQIKTAADAIVTAQTDEIAQLRRIAKQLGVRPAAMPMAGMHHGDHATMPAAEALGLSPGDMGMSMDMDALSSARPFDRAFIDMMIRHHQGAIRMARAELARGKNPQLRQIARGIVGAQAHEIREMNAWRADWYGQPSPAGRNAPSGVDRARGSQHSPRAVARSPSGRVRSLPRPEG